jgi:predicted RNA-binding Zn ribbon-like protein
VIRSYRLRNPQVKLNGDEILDNTKLIQDYVNTLHKDIHGDEEDLATPAELTSWLAANQLGQPGVKAGAADLRQAKELREALRTLLLAKNEVEVDEAPAQDVLDRMACKARVGLRFENGEPALVPTASGVTGALGRIVVAVHDAVADGSWQRLKACRCRDCEWAFVDTAKNQSRAWCSMRSCGNREKARAYRARQAHSS